MDGMTSHENVCSETDAVRFGNILREYVGFGRNSWGFERVSVKQIAHTLDKSESYVRRMFDGIMTPSYGTLLRLVQRLPAAFGSEVFASTGKRMEEAAKREEAVTGFELAAELAEVLALINRMGADGRFDERERHLIAHASLKIDTVLHRYQAGVLT